MRTSMKRDSECLRLVVTVVIDTALPYQTGQTAVVWSSSCVSLYMSGHQRRDGIFR